MWNHESFNMKYSHKKQTIVCVEHAIVNMKVSHIASYIAFSGYTTVKFYSLESL